MAQSKDKNVFIRNIIIVIVFATLLIGIIYFAAAKYTDNVTGIGNSLIARPIIETIVESYEAGENELNPYALVTVRNYNDKDEITQMALNFEVNVVSVDGKELPEYYFSDSEGNKLGTTVTGALGQGTKEEVIYKVTFVNVADEEVSKNFKIVATTSQDTNE